MSSACLYRNYAILICSRLVGFVVLYVAHARDCDVFGVPLSVCASGSVPDATRVFGSFVFGALSTLLYSTLLYYNNNYY